MHAFLLVGNTKDARIKEILSRITKLKISSWDTIKLTSDAPSIGIESVRDFVSALATSPLHSPSKVGVIEDMDRLTIEAQNALLKTLEEPPPHTYLMAETQSDDMLLPTILSRFVVVTLGPAANESVKADVIPELLRGGIAQRMQYIDTVAGTREDAKQFVDHALGEIHAMIHGDNPAIATQTLTLLGRKLLTARSQLAVNVNPRLVLDTVFLDNA